MYCAACREAQRDFAQCSIFRIPMLWETGLLFRKTAAKRRNCDGSPSSRNFEGSFLRKLSTYELSSCPPWLSRQHRLPRHRFLFVLSEEVSEKMAPENGNYMPRRSRRVYERPARTTRTPCTTRSWATVQAIYVWCAACLPTPATALWKIAKLVIALFLSVLKRSELLPSMLSLCSHILLLPLIYLFIYFLC